jgi:hypothetical protein
VGTAGGTSGNFQSRARTISLHGCSTSGGTSHRGPIEEEEEEEEGEEEEEEEGEKEEEGEEEEEEGEEEEGGGEEEEEEEPRTKQNCTVVTLLACGLEVFFFTFRQG